MYEVSFTQKATGQSKKKCVAFLSSKENIVSAEMYSSLPVCLIKHRHVPVVFCLPDTAQQHRRRRHIRVRNLPRELENVFG